VALGRVLDQPGVVVVHLLLNEETGLPSQSRCCCFSFRTTARVCIGERRRRDSTSDANATSEESIVDGVVRARNTSRSSHARAIEGSAREGKGRAWKVAARFERSGAHLVGQVRLLDVALVLGHRGGFGVGVGVGVVGLGVCVQPVRRAQKVVDRVVTQPCHIPLRLDSNRSESSPRFARYHEHTAVQSKKPNSVPSVCSKNYVDKWAICANVTGHPRRFVSPDRDDLEEPGRLSFLARRGSVPFGELVLRRDLVPELFPPPSAGFLSRRVRVGTRQRCFRTS